jgi:hypothetical protein
MRPTHWVQRMPPPATDRPAQAPDTEAETTACRIRPRAEGRAGQLLAEMEKNNGGGDQKSDHHSRAGSGDRKPLSAFNISHNQSSRWQNLAAIPEADFEATFQKPGKPSTTGIIAAHRETVEAQAEPPPSPTRALSCRPVRPAARWWQEPCQRCRSAGRQILQMRCDARTEHGMRGHPPIDALPNTEPYHAVFVGTH